ncbi:hypothetical protein [Epilithonimonas vandammei]|uniref:hypothetical protein n=1 Tax=Epilithonimonas vandammei TaxID=2487072 RepID=UPI0028A6D02A|nr:hypothetical protein [Epilithonimonas vandammei]
MNIVYLVFGNKIENYQQAYFSIFTALLHKNDEDKIIVITDDSSLFGFFENIIETIFINQDTIKDWEGPHQFFWRVKIKALQLVAQKYPEDSILYLDSDTFFYKNIEVLRSALQSGQHFMHLDEGKLSQLSSKTEKLMWKQMKGKSYGNIIINENVAMWNAGLIGVSQKHFECLELTLQINDAMCADGVTRRLIEQFAFSLGLNQYSELQPADHIVGHYWGNKKQWNDTISLFLRECFMKKYDFGTVIERVKEMELSKIPIRIKESSTQRKLKNLIDKFYTNQRPVYVKK